VAATPATKIVSLSPTATEDLFAIGAGSQVVAVDDLSNFPTTAPITKLSAFTPNVEAIAAYSPDLVIINSTATGADSVKSQLNSLGIQVYMEKTPSVIADAYSEISDLGAATGRTAAATTLITSMQKKIATAMSVARRTKSLTFFHELDNTLYSATSDTFIGHVYKDFHLTNIADKAAKADSGGYPQLQREYVIKANPAIIFLADSQYGENAATVAKRAGWKSISAVTKHQVVALPADIPSRWGPRLVDFYQFIAQAIKSAK
jgi:iron complex transport system substrate-binding protein